MSHDIRFQAFILPNTDWHESLGRFQRMEAFGFDVVSTADHFVDWSNPPSPWLEAWTLLGAVARETKTIRLSTCVSQIPLRHPAMFARQALTLDHLSEGRIEVGLGTGLEIDPSYEMMGIPNWTAKERVARFREYIAVVDQLLSNEVTTYKGKFYEINGAYMNPRPVQSPRPPIMIAAMGPVMIKRVAEYADIWNSLSFAENFEAQLSDTRNRIDMLHSACERIGRDPQSIRISYQMFDPQARTSGGRFSCYESQQLFTDMVGQLKELGVTEFGLYYPMLDEQVAMFERIATQTIPTLR